MFFKSCLINVFTVNIFVFIIRSEKKLIVILLFKKLIYEKQPALIHNIGVNYVDNRFGENENEAVETHTPRHRDFKRPKSHDIEIATPKNRDINIRGLKHHDIEKWRQLSHDIVIPRYFFRGGKGTTSRFQD